MQHKRNVDGLLQNAQKKREEAISRTEDAIRELIQKGHSINFKVVAEAAKVSTAFLYKEPEIKSRIEYLRGQGTSKAKSAPVQQKASDASKDAKYQALKQRLQKVEAENKGLRDHMEAIHGRYRVMTEEYEQARREVQRLTKLLNEAKSEIEVLKHNQDPSISLKQELIEVPSKITPLSRQKQKHKNCNLKIKSLLEDLGIAVNSTLGKQIQSVSEEIVLKAVKSLKEAQTKTEVKNPSGFLVAAIKGAWTPNEEYEQKIEKNIFNEWWNLAKKQGLVTHAMAIDGVQHVLTIEEEWIPFNEILIQYPLEDLKSKI